MQMFWVQDHGGDWVNLAACFSLTVEPVAQPDGAPLFQLRATGSAGMLYAVLAAAPEPEAVLQMRDALAAQLRKGASHTWANGATSEVKEPSPTA